jgi:hypothetical protein
VGEGYRLVRSVSSRGCPLKDAVDLDSVQADLANVVNQVLEPAHISVWTNQQGCSQVIGNSMSARPRHPPSRR